MRNPAAGSLRLPRNRGETTGRGGGPGPGCSSPVQEMGLFPRGWEGGHRAAAGPAGNAVAGARLRVDPRPALPGHTARGGTPARGEGVPAVLPEPVGDAREGAGRGVGVRSRVERLRAAGY